MASKLILVLVNSILGKRRIIAGREFINNNGKMSVGRWGRPVSNPHHKEIGLNECRLNDSSYPVILDIVQVPLPRSSMIPISLKASALQTAPHRKNCHPWPPSMSGTSKKSRTTSGWKRTLQRIG